MEIFLSLIKYCPIQNNWILLMNYESIINHTDRKIYQIDDKGDLVDSDTTEINKLCHIYFSYMTDKLLVALVLTTNGQLVLINNQVKIDDTVDTQYDPIDPNEEEVIRLNAKIELPVITGVNSTLYIIKDAKDLMNVRIMSNATRKAIGIKEWYQNTGKRYNYQNFGYWSFFEKFNTTNIYEWIKQCGSTVDFSNNYILSDRDLIKLPEIYTVTSIKLSQNCQITNFDWMSRFPLLSELFIDQCQQIDLSNIANIYKVAKGLRTLNIKYCCSINIRILLDLLKSNNLQHIAIDYPNFYCQVSEKEVLISRNEWRIINNSSLKTLFINSENMTVDVIDYIIKACTELKDIYLDDNILKLVAKNIVFNEDSVNETNVVNFHSAVDFRKGFKASRPMTFKNMFKNNVSAPFSKSMLNRIRQNDGSEPVAFDINF